MLPDSLLHGVIYMFSNHKAGSPPDPFHMLRAAIMTSEAKKYFRGKTNDVSRLVSLLIKAIQYWLKTDKYAIKMFFDFGIKQ